MGRLSITTAPLNRLTGGFYTDLSNTIEIMRKIWGSSIVDGFEFQNLAEWDIRGPPRDIRINSDRITAWEKSTKFTTIEKGDLLRTSGAPVISVHANRDVGICLCSEDEADQELGRQMVHETHQLAELVGSEIVVFHLWDTWKANFDPEQLRNELNKITSSYPGVTATVENVPTHLEGHTPFDIVRKFDWITLDTRWAGMYDELDAFEELQDKIINVHLRGSLEGDSWILHDSPFTFDWALDRICNKWGYSGLLTVEPERGRGPPGWDGFIKAMKRLNAFS